jgi:polyhydroxyalkanoate synthesis regulator phasin
MNRLKLTVGVILVFLVGALAGSLGTGIYFRHKMEDLVSGASGRLPRTAFLMKKLSDELNLTEAQKVEVEDIIRRHRERILAVRGTYLPEIKQITNQSFSLIREKLNHEQQQKLDHLQKKLERLRNRALPDRGAGADAP